MQLELPDHLNLFLDEQVRNGRHTTATEVVLAALRRHEAALATEQDRLAEIRAVIDEGAAAISLGDYLTIVSPADQEGLRARLTRASVAVPSRARP